MKYIANSFSLQMIAGNCNLKVREIGLAEAIQFSGGSFTGGTISRGNEGQKPREFSIDIISAIGHKDTAEILSGLLKNRIPENRINIDLKHQDDVLLVCQLVGGRLPEGTTTLPEGFSFKFFLVSFLSLNIEKTAEKFKQINAGWYDLHNYDDGKPLPEKTYNLLEKVIGIPEFE